MDSTADFSESYDIFTSSDDYARRFSGGVGEWMLRVQEEATMRMLTPHPNASVLYVGGGHGQGMDALLRNGHEVTVLGSDGACMERIRSHVESGRVHFVTGKLLEMPFPDGSFDIVIAYRLCAHIVRWQEFLAELARVARQAVIVDYPEARSINSIAPSLFGLKKRLEGNTRKYQCLREPQLLQVFEQSGFGRTDRYPQFFLPMALHRALKQPAISAALENACRLTRLTFLLGSPVILKAERSDRTAVGR